MPFTFLLYCIFWKVELLWAGEKAGSSHTRNECLILAPSRGVQGEELGQMMRQISWRHDANCTPLVCRLWYCLRVEQGLSLWHTHCDADFSLLTTWLPSAASSISNRQTSLSCLNCLSYIPGDGLLNCRMQGSSCCPSVIFLYIMGLILIIPTSPAQLHFQKKKQKKKADIINCSICLFGQSSAKLNLRPLQSVSVHCI